MAGEAMAGPGATDIAAVTGEAVTAVAGAAAIVVAGAAVIVAVGVAEEPAHR